MGFDLEHYKKDETKRITLTFDYEDFQMVDILLRLIYKDIRKQAYPVPALLKRLLTSLALEAKELAEQQEIELRKARALEQYPTLKTVPNQKTDKATIGEQAGGEGSDHPTPSVPDISLHGEESDAA